MEIPIKTKAIKMALINYLIVMGFIGEVFTRSIKIGDMMQSGG